MADTTLDRTGPERGAHAARPATHPELEQAHTGRWLEPALFIGAHALLAMAMSHIPLVAVAHAVLVLLVGAWWALTRPPEWVAYVGFYIAGAEVLWRMNAVYEVLPWELGKYSTIAIFALAALRARTSKIPTLAFFYFLFLLPSILQLLPIVDLREAADRLSFNLSGPLALMVCAWLFSNLTITPGRLRRLLVMLVAPATAIATLLLRNLLSSPDLVWGTLSSFSASAGYGPNQVASAMGLALLAVWLLLLFGNLRGVSIIGLIGLGLWFLAQALLTFSRGGIFSALAAAAASVAHALLAPRLRGRALALLVVGALVLVMILIPRLETLTADALGVRFTDTSLSGRWELGLAELEVFGEHPFLGVGPGGAGPYRAAVVGRTVASHTEFTRLLAEHGLLGLVASVLVIGMAWHNYRRVAHDPITRGVVATILVWALTFLAHSATRLVAPSLLLGLSFAAFDLDSSSGKLHRQAFDARATPRRNVARRSVRHSQQ